MSIRHTASPGDFYLRFVDQPETTFPAPSESPWTLSWIESMDGSLETTELQYAFNFGTVGSANTIVAAHHANDANKGKVRIYTASGTTGYVSTNTFTTGAYLFMLSADVTNGFRLRSCQILLTQPGDGSAVKVEFVKTLAEAKVDTALDIPGIMTGRSNANARKYDQSLARLWFYPGDITDHEMAMMAFGMEITELGKVPKWYYRMNDPTDITNRGSLTLPMSKVGSGTMAAGNTIPFGYDSSNPPSNQAPTITGTPTINEAPAAGQSVTYTRAPANGIPAPTITQQWQIAGQDVAGATGASFLLPSDSGGKTVAVRQIATSVAGTASSTSATRTVAAPPNDAVTSAPMPAETIYQRLGTSLSIPMSGTYTGTVPDRFEYQLYDAEGISILLPWTALPSPTIGSGAWSATPLVPQGGMYRRRVRSLKNNVVVATGGIETEVWGVGARCGMIGSSSAQYAFNSNGNGGSGFVPRADVRLRSTAGWAKMSDQGWGISIANDLASRLGVPVGMLGFGVGGATLGSWSAKGSGWNPFAAAAVLDGTGIEFCVITVGSNDGGNGTVPSKEIHRDRLRTLIANVRAIPNCAGIPIALSGANRRPGVTAYDQQFNWIRTAENEVGDDAGVVHIQSLDYPLEDGVHLSKGAAGYPALATRINYQFGTVVSGGPYRRGPKLISMKANGAVVTCTIQHRGSTDFTPPAAGTFKAFAADGTAIVVSSVARVSATTFTVTCASQPDSLRYLDGGDPGTATQMYGNTTPTLPMTVETEMVFQNATNASGYITSQPAPNGQSQRFVGVTSNATSGSYTLNNASGQAVVGPTSFSITNNAFDFTITDLEPDSYTPQLLVTGTDGVTAVTGTAPFSIAGVSGGGQIYPDPPSIPLNVTAVAGINSALVSFSPPATGGMINSYEVLASSGETQVGTASPISIQVTTRQPVTFAVRAFNDVGPGLYSAASNSITPIAPADTENPIFSGQIQVLSVGQTSITFAWPEATDNTGVAGYETSVNGQPYEDEGATLVRDLFDLTEDTDYFIQVRAYDSAGNRSASIQSIIRTQPVLVDTGVTQLAVDGPTFVTIGSTGGALKLKLPTLDIPAPRSRTIFVGGQTTTITS